MGDSVQRTCFFVAGMLLVALVALVANFSLKQEDSAPRPYFANISDTTLSNVFRMAPSNACLFLSAVNTWQNGTGTMQWRNPHPVEQNATLTSNDTHPTVHVKGFYLLFVQVTFKIKCSENEDSCSDLMLRVNHHYHEGSSYFSAVFKTHCEAPTCDKKSNRKDVDMALSQPILLWMKPQDSLSISASNMEWVDYEQNPTSTFLTLFKYSD